MTRTLIFTVVPACASVALGAAGLGCSGSDRRGPQDLAWEVEWPEPPPTKTE